MRLVKTILALLFFAAVSTMWMCGADAQLPAAPAPSAEAATGPASAEHHGLPSAASDLARIGPLPISNSMVMTWAIAILLIIFARRATRQIQAVPAGAQNFWEWLVELLHDFLQGIIGSQLVKRTFWFFATIFIFILFSNWFGLIPGVGTVFITTDQGREALLRGGNADLNMTFAMAMVFFACWLIWSLQIVGPLGILKDLFAPKGETTGPLKLLMILVFFAVGFLEILSILFRPISLSFRLYGNIFAGENMLEAMGKLVPGLGWLLPIPFYFMELLVGLVQALVFMLLTAVFTMLMCQHEEGTEEGHH